MDSNTQPILLPSSPTSDMPIRSIEDSFSDSAPSASGRDSHGGDSAVFDSNPESHSTRESSPRTSSDCDSRFAGEEQQDDEEEEGRCTDEDDLISSLPSESRASSCLPFLQHGSLPYTPSKQRSPFRNPSSVRDMQLDLTPPHLRSPTATSSRRSHQQHSRSNSSRNSHYSHSHSHRPSATSRNSTPRSIRSHFSTRHSPSKSKTPGPIQQQQQQQPQPKKEHPLVLLHVTLLPITSPYSVASLSALAPPHVLANWTLLREKVPDTVLERGILIPHPRDDYELLEERLLESLELATPRILKCGHFRRVDSEGEEELQQQGAGPEGTKDGVRAEHGDWTCTAAAASAENLDEDEGEHDPDLCSDCGRRVRDGRLGSAGRGSKRWDIRIYAANGLMRAGAWGAAWREMERVDVEIYPWMEDSVKKELEEARAVEEREAAVRDMEGGPQEETVLMDGGEIGQGRERSPCRMDEERMREIYGEGDAHADVRMRGGEAKGQAFVDGLEDEVKVEARSKSAKQERSAGRTTAFSSETPIQELLVNYLRLLLQDRKNVALAVLSFLVLLMVVRPVHHGPPVPALVPAVAPEMAPTQLAFSSPVAVSSSGLDPAEVNAPTATSGDGQSTSAEPGAGGSSSSVTGERKTVGQEVADPSS